MAAILDFMETFNTNNVHMCTIDQPVKFCGNIPQFQILPYSLPIKTIGVVLWPLGGDFPMAQYPELFVIHLSTYMPSLVLLSQMGTILSLIRPTIDHLQYLLKSLLKQHAYTKMLIYPDL